METVRRQDIWNDVTFTDFSLLSVYKDVNCNDIVFREFE